MLQIGQLVCDPTKQCDKSIGQLVCDLTKQCDRSIEQLVYFTLSIVVQIYDRFQLYTSIVFVIHVYHRFTFVLTLKVLSASMVVFTFHL